MAGRLFGNYARDEVGAQEVQEPVTIDTFSGEIFVTDMESARRNSNGESFEGRAWLLDVLRAPRPIGFDLEWRPDRKGGDNPVALVQLASEEQVVLLRTHRSRRWLPKLVVDIITSPEVHKVCVGFDACDKQKLKNSFGIEASGIVDLAVIAARKGFSRLGLKALTKHFGWNLLKDSVTACSDWECAQLTERQRRYAADDAYFSLMLLPHLERLPDALAPETTPEVVPQKSGPAAACPVVDKEWAENGVVRKSDGLWCTLCNKGPIAGLEAMDRHIESKQHQKRAAAAGVAGAKVVTAADGPGVPEDLLARGVRREPEGPSAGQFVCVLCEAGPFPTLESVRRHVDGRSHLRKEVARSSPDPTPELAAEGIIVKEEGEDVYLSCAVCSSGRFVDLESAQRHIEGRVHRRKAAEQQQAQQEPVPPPPPKRPPPTLTEETLASVPGYVSATEDGNALCVLCNVRATSLLNICQHLNSERHAKNCRKWGEPEIVFVPERDHFEELRTGRVVRRKPWSWPEAPLAEAPEKPREGGNRKSRSVPPWRRQASDDAAGTAASAGRRRRVRFADPDDSDSDDACAVGHDDRLRGHPTRGGKAQASSSSSARTAAAAAAEADSRCPLAQAAAEAAAMVAAAQGHMLVRALRGVIGAGGAAAASAEGEGWLPMREGELVVVEAKDDSGDLFWGRITSTSGGETRSGWIASSDVMVIPVPAVPESSAAMAAAVSAASAAAAPPLASDSPSAGPAETGDVCAAPADVAPPPGKEGGHEASPAAAAAPEVAVNSPAAVASTAEAALVPGAVAVTRRTVDGPSDGWDAANFLVLGVGEVLHVEHVEDDWLWARTTAGSSGWAPVSAVTVRAC